MTSARGAAQVCQRGNRIVSPLPTPSRENRACRGPRLRGSRFVLAADPPFPASPPGWANLGARLTALEVSRGRKLFRPESKEKNDQRQEQWRITCHRSYLDGRSLSRMPAGRSRCTLWLR